MKPFLTKLINYQFPQICLPLLKKQIVRDKAILYHIHWLVSTSIFICLYWQTETNQFFTNVNPRRINGFSLKADDKSWNIFSKVINWFFQSGDMIRYETVLYRKSINYSSICFPHIARGGLNRTKRGWLQQVPLNLMMFSMEMAQFP